MNILDHIKEILPQAYLGSMPAKPDEVVALFEYEAEPPSHSFGSTDYSYGLQARTRANTADRAYQMAKDMQNRLNRYTDSEISILQTSSILDIGVDDNNPPRQEYTVNFIVRRL